MNRILLLGLFFLSLNAFSQSPTALALYTLNHDVNNNKFNLKTKPTIESFSEKKNTIWTNVYFRYYRNKNLQGSMKPDESFKFSILNQYFFNIYNVKDTIYTINIAKGLSEKYINVDVLLFELVGGKVLTTKVKSKFYTVTNEEGKFEIQLKAGFITPGSYLQVLVETESLNFKKLGPFKFNRLGPGDYEFLLTTNIPEIFTYSISDELQYREKIDDVMRLKEFTFSTPPIVDYIVSSYSYRWNLPEMGQTKELHFILKSINFQRNVGTSVEQLMKFSY